MPKITHILSGGIDPTAVYGDDDLAERLAAAAKTGVYVNVRKA